MPVNILANVESLSKLVVSPSILMISSASEGVASVLGNLTCVGNT